MARIKTVLAALWKAIQREGKFAGATSNNFFLVGAAFLFLGDAGAFVSLNAAVAVVLFFPLSTDPLRKIPAVRLALWPLTRQDRWLLRVLSPWLNPVTWLLAALALWRGVAISLWATIAGIFIIVFALPSFGIGSNGRFWRAMPKFPGRFSQLIRKDLRQNLCTLDFYCALIWSALGAYTRMRGVLPADALVPMTMIVALALSTIALNLFGADGGAGITRYRLLPVPGWQILLAKDAAFLLTVLVLTAPLSPLAGVGSAMVALAIGHDDSVNRRHDETRWRFRTSPAFGRSIFQVIAMIMAGVCVGTVSPLYLVACAAVYGGSTWWFGRVLER